MGGDFGSLKWFLFSVLKNSCCFIWFSVLKFGCSGLLVCRWLFFSVLSWILSWCVSNWCVGLWK